MNDSISVSIQQKNPIRRLGHVHLINDINEFRRLVLNYHSVLDYYQNGYCLRHCFAP